MNIFFVLLAEDTTITGLVPDISDDIARLDYRAVLVILVLVVLLALADRSEKGG